MKRLLLLSVMIMTVLSIKADLFDIRSVPGIVHYADGHQQEFKSIKLPPSGAKKFTAKDQSGKSVTIKYEDVAYLEVWHPKAPEESRDYLYCCVSKKADGTKELSGWSFLVSDGKRIKFYSCLGVYYMTKTGLIMRMKNSAGPNLIYIKPDTSTEYQHFGLLGILEMRSKTTVKRLVEEVISDDPSLCKVIQEKNWKGKVYDLLDFVAGAYSPKK